MRNKGNKLANKEAKRLTKLLPSAEHTKYLTLQSTKQKIRGMKDNAWKLEWERGGNSKSAKTYLDLWLKPSLRAKSLLELRLKRQV